MIGDSIRSQHRPPQLHALAVLCGALLLALGCTQTSHHKSDKQAAELPVLAHVPSFSLTNQDERAFGSKQLAGAPYVAAFMFTRCPSVCPRLTSTMKGIDALLTKEGVAAHLVSISVDPTFDTPAVLSDYVRKHAIDARRWTFLTGEYSDIAQTAEQGFKVGLTGSVDERQPHLGITHASHLILVDAQGAIRGYFRSSDEDVAQQLLSGIRSISG